MAAQDIARDINLISFELMEKDRLDAFRKVLDGFDGRDKDEQSIAHLFFISMAVVTQTQSYLARQSLAEDSIVNALSGFVAAVMRTPGGEEWWAKWGPTFDPNFFETMSNLIAAQRESDVPSLFEIAPWYSSGTPREA